MCKDSYTYVHNLCCEENKGGSVACCHSYNKAICLSAKQTSQDITRKLQTSSKPVSDFLCVYFVNPSFSGERNTVLLEMRLPPSYSLAVGVSLSCDMS